MELVVDSRGQVVALYGEQIDLGSLGTLAFRRAGHVEPDDEGRWWVDLQPLNGPRWGPFDRRSAALIAEEAWIAAWLTKAS
jgi:hypothetical protein